MFNPLSLIADYDGSLAFINSLDVYKTTEGTDELLDLIRELQFSGNYYWQGVAIPLRDSTLIPGLGTLSGSVQLPSGTYVVSMTVYSAPDVGGVTWGSKLKIWDKGTKTAIAYGDYILDRLIASTMDQFIGVGTSNPPTDPGINGDTPFGQAFFTSPLIITDPGVLGWEIVNLNPAATDIQYLIAVAIPINKRTVNQLVVDRAA